MLELKHVSKEYNTQKVLDDINLCLPNKGLISIVGVSGSGKSTLLNVIGGIDKVTEGNIYIDNCNITKFNNKEMDWYHKKYVGFIFQSYNLIEYLSVKDNLLLVNNNVYHVLKKLNIYHLRNKKVSLLSGGEKQRVAIARGILKNPKILLCDEPTGALDRKSSIIIMEILKELSKDRLVLVVTHDIELANKYSDHIINIKDGKVNRINIKDKVNKTPKIKNSSNNIAGISFKHFRYKLKRNILISISFAIGLIALGLVLSISNGFKRSLENEERNSLSKYPIEISSLSYSNDTIDNTTTSNDKVYLYDINHLNNITRDYINNISVIDDKLDYKIYIYHIDNHSLMTSQINDYMNEFNILYGSNISNPNEVLLILDSNNRINMQELNSIGLSNTSYEYEDLINYSFKVNKKKYIIKGIIKAKDNSIMADISGILFDKSNFINNIPDEIYLYPSNYDNKQIVINKLNEYNEIKYIDLSTTFKNISTTIIDGISIVLVVFSLIILIVSSLLISILTYINIMEYKEEIGIYKSLGISNKNIKEVFYIENIITMAISCLIALSIIKIISIPINMVIYNLTGLSNVLVTSNSITLSIIILSIILSVVFSYIPIKSISKINIVDILRHE